MAAFIGFLPIDGLKVGLEGVLTQSSNGFNTGTALKTKSGLGLSMFANYALRNDLNLVGRYDFYDPNTDGGAKADSRNYVIAGLDWKVNDRVSVIPNVQIETYEKAPLKTFDASVTGRLTMVWIF
jgi:predicted porin